MTETGRLQVPQPVPLSEETFTHSLRFLSARDPDLDGILTNLGRPSLREAEPGFPTLVRIIMSQQVSPASAKTVYDRLLTTVSPLTPGRFLDLDDAAFRAIGFSRQKIAYVRGLALEIVEGRLDLDELATMDDTTVRSELVRLKGIGPWTADIYLLTALRRPDVLPCRDLALATAAQQVKRLPTRPTPDELDEIGDQWRPWRSVAALLLWHHYVNDGAVRSPQGS